MKDVECFGTCGSLYQHFCMSKRISDNAIARVQIDRCVQVPIYTCCGDLGGFNVCVELYKLTNCGLIEFHADIICTKRYPSFVANISCQH